MHKADRLRAIMGDGGLANCGNSQNCVQSCPKGIPLTTSIAALNRDTTIQSFKDFFGSDITIINIASSYRRGNIYNCIFLFILFI